MIRDNVTSIAKGLLFSAHLLGDHLLNSISVGRYLAQLAFLLALSASTLVQAQQDQETGTTVELPEKFKEAKDRQVRLALDADVVLHRVDAGRNSSSTIQGVPREFRALRILDEFDLERILPRLYSYYALVGTESLKLE